MKKITMNDIKESNSRVDLVLGIHFEINSKGAASILPKKVQRARGALFIVSRDDQSHKQTSSGTMKRMGKKMKQLNTVMNIRGGAVLSETTKKFLKASGVNLEPERVMTNTDKRLQGLTY